MSFIKYEKFISFGDRVIIYLGHDEIQSILISKDVVHQTKYGAIKHDELVGKPFGCKLQILKGFVHILHPTPELWTLALRHRTQILYNIDISEILFKLDIRPGSMVVEAGTGSGSLSHSILRSVYPSGHLHTFDFHSGRVEEAQREFNAHGFDSKLVTIKERDVCAEGFGLGEGSVDAVFLDLPSPWLAVGHAAYALVEGGRICCFSPCIEQVQRTYKVLLENKFSDLITVECLNRELIVRETSLTLPDLGFNNSNKNIDNTNDTNVFDSNINNCFINESKDENVHLNIDKFLNTNNKDPDLTSSNIVDLYDKTDTKVDSVNELFLNNETINNDQNNRDCINLDTNKNIDLIKDSTLDNPMNTSKDNVSKAIELIKVNDKLYCKDCINSGEVLMSKSSAKCKADVSYTKGGEAKLPIKDDEIDSVTEVKRIKLEGGNNGIKLANKQGFKSKGELSFVSLSSGLKITGHTGYLTFATLYPS